MPYHAHREGSYVPLLQDGGFAHRLNIQQFVNEIVFSLFSHFQEAQSINKSLSALGDVISALSSGQDFVPYRNNRLTLLMQDSLGGNAKTLMFVNISPTDYNAEETVTSLTYAARVKLITNDASKNAENKEIARLKGIIAKLKKGEELAENEDV